MTPTVPDKRISKASWVLDEKEQAAAIITCVMSDKQWERDDAARKIQRHILAVEAERDAREAECEALSDRAHMAEHALTAEAKRLDWLERNHTLHNSVAILYVVDGYEVQFSTQDGNNLVAETHGETLRDAIDKCMEEVP